MSVTVADRSIPLDSAAAHSDQIVVGLVNNMPDGAIRSTEQQFVGLLNGAAGNREVLLRLFSASDVPRSESARSVLLQNYADIEDLWDSHVDALIVTGNEPRAPSLPEEPYWPTLTRLVDWAEENTVSTIWSCLAAHAAVLHLDGVGRHAFGSKLSGIFDCKKTSEHAIVAQAPPQWRVPHSRQYGLREDELVNKGYRPLTRSPIAGVDTFLKQRNSLFLFFQGHLEYDPQSLYKEYVRDIGRYLNAERETYPDMPQGYFDAEAAAAFMEFRARALQERSSSLLSVFPARAIEGKLVNSWRSPATSIYRAWLSYIAAGKADRLQMHPIDALAERPVVSVD